MQQWLLIRSISMYIPRDVEYYDKPNPYALTKELMFFKWDRLFALPLQREFLHTKQHPTS